MTELLQEYLTTITGPDATVYVVRSWGGEIGRNVDRLARVSSHGRYAANTAHGSGDVATESDGDRILGDRTGAGHFEGAFERAHV
jgi:hypothetical protein